MLKSDKKHSVKYLFVHLIYKRDIDIESKQIFANIKNIGQNSCFLSCFYILLCRNSCIVTMFEKSRSIYEISRGLWRGLLAPSALGFICLSFTSFLDLIDDIITNIVQLFTSTTQPRFLFFDKQTTEPVASQSDSYIGIGFSFSNAIACSDAQAIVFC